jgi:hypothetical protein
MRELLSLVDNIPNRATNRSQPGLLASKTQLAAEGVVRMITTDYRKNSNHVPGSRKTAPTADEREEIQVVLAYVMQ